MAMTQEQWADIVRHYNAFWRNNPLPKASIAVWYEALKRFSGDRVRRAVDELGLTEHFPPSLAQLNEKCIAIGREHALRNPTVPELPDGDDPPRSRRHVLPAGARGWCAKCQSALLGYDPPGDTCRNCDPEYRISFRQARTSPKS